MMMQDRGFQQDQAGQANTWMNDQATNFMNQQHQVGMAQADRDHQQQQMASSAAPTAQPSQAPSQASSQAPSQTQAPIQAPIQAPVQAAAQAPQFVIQTQRGHDEVEENRSMMEAIHQNLQTGAAMTNALNELAQIAHESNAHLAAALQTMHSHNVGHADRMGSAMESLAHIAQNHSNTSDAILQALSRKRKVMRDKDGKIQGVE
jgi:hypothetical protein